MRIAGIILILLGLIAFIVGEIPYRSEEASMEIGGVEMTVEERRTVPVAPWPAVVLLLVGAGLLVVDMRGRRAA